MNSPLNTIRPNAQLYTLLLRNNETGQMKIVQYDSSAILTTELDDLVVYTNNLVHHYGKQYTYTISMVTSVPVASPVEIDMHYNGYMD